MVPFCVIGRIHILQNRLWNMITKESFVAYVSKRVTVRRFLIANAQFYKAYPLVFLGWWRVCFFSEKKTLRSVLHSLTFRHVFRTESGWIARRSAAGYIWEDWPWGYEAVNFHVYFFVLMIYFRFERIEWAEDCSYRNIGLLRRFVTPSVGKQLGPWVFKQEKN